MTSLHLEYKPNFALAQMQIQPMEIHRQQNAHPVILIDIEIRKFPVPTATEAP